MKFTLYFLLVLSCFVTETYVGNAQCTTSTVPNMYDGCKFGDAIDAFTLNGIATSGNSGCNNLTTAYGFYNTSRTLTIGSTYSFSATVGTSGSIPYTEYFAIWIDYNSNGLYNASGELAYASSGKGNTHSGSFTVPANATAGTVSMRTRCKYDGPVFGAANACTDDDYGETEDYTVTLVCPSVSVSVGANPSSTICPGTSVTFTATPVNGGASPTYQWKKNGSNVGTNSTTYSDAGLLNSDVITCVMTPTFACAGTATSPNVTITVVPTATPSVSIGASPSNTVCAATSVTFTATPTNGGTSPTYQWKKNGSNIATGVSWNAGTSLATGDAITCVMTSNYLCPTGGISVITSNTVNMTVNPDLTPSVSIGVSPGNSFCPGTNATFTATPTNGGATPAYQWKKNGSNTGTNNANYSDNTLTTGDVITCVMTSNYPCLTGGIATATSNGITINTSFPASVSIVPNTATTVCAGTSVTFTATPTNGGSSAYQWKKNGGNVGTGLSTFTDVPGNGDVYSVQMTSSIACASPKPATSNTVTINTISNTPSVSITSDVLSNRICPGTNVTFTATPTNGGTTPAYQWKKNGSNVGINNATYSNAGLLNGDQITCQMTSNATCLSAPGASSNTITMTVNIITWYQDNDGDGFGNSAATQLSCSKPSGYVQNNIDCNDNSVNITTWASVGTAGFSTGAMYNATSRASGIAIDGSGTPYIAYTDPGNGFDIEVMKFNGASWATVGSPGISGAASDFVDIKFDGSSTPYIVYRDGNSDNSTVKKFNGASWVTVGSAGFSLTNAVDEQIAIDGSGTPYVVYSANCCINQATVMKFNGSNWVTVGGADFTPNNAIRPSIALDGSGTPYVAFGGPGSSSFKASVMKFNGTSWVTVGSPDFSAGEAAFTSIAIDGSGTPYVAYADGGNSYKATVMKFNGTSWTVVGSAGFSAGFASNTKMVIDGSGTPYVTYSDAGNSNKTTVMKFDGSNWVAVGSAGISAGGGFAPEIALNAVGIPYVLYRDNSNGNKATVMTIKPVEIAPATPTLSASVNPICNGGNTNLSVTAGSLNDATNWKWYTGSCGGTAAGSGTSISVSPTTTTTYYARGEGSCLTTPGSCGTITVTVNPVPSVTTATTANTCSGTDPNIALAATVPSTFAWTLGTNTGSITGASAASGSTINQTLTNPSNATAGSIVYAVTPTSTTGSCVGTATNITVTVNPKPSITTSTIASTCSGTSPNVALTASAASSFAWTIGTNTGAITGASNGSGSAINQTLTNPSNVAAGSIVYAVTPTSTTGSCVGSAANITVTVNPKPSVTTSATASICNNTSPNIVLASSAPGSFAWALGTNTGGITGASASSGASINQTLNNPSSSANGSIVYAVTPTSTTGSCIGAATNITVTVFPTPTVNTIAGQTRCNGTATTAISISGPVSGTSFTWTNDKPSIGLAASGSGSTINAFTAQNTGTSPLIATITVTPTANGCTGTASTFTITVNPTPTVNAIASQARCNGATTATVALSGPVSGTSFAWTNNTTSIGLAANGSGSTINAFTALNTTFSPVTATVTITPTANSCVGTLNTFNITVNPTPTVNTVANQVLCNGTNSSAVSFAGSVSGTGFAWTNSATSIGLAASGLGNISSFTAANIGNTPLTANIIVTPSANSCTGPSGTFSITVNPTPTVNLVSNQALCDGVSTTAINFGGPVSGTAYTWVNNTSSIGLGTNGVGNIAAFTGSNSSTAPITATITVTPSANGCSGPTGSFIITVNPIPVLSSVLDATPICNSTVFSYTPTSATLGTTFSWSRASVTGISNASASGINNPGETLANITPDSAVVTYVYNIVANSCVNNQDVTVTVYPSAKLNSAKSGIICSGDIFKYTPTSLTKATSFAWTRTTPGITPGTSNGTGTINEALINNGSAPVLATYIYTLTAFGCSNTDNVALTINTLPAMPIISIKPPTELCMGTRFQNFGAPAPLSGIDYTWDASNANIWTRGLGNQNILVSFPSPGNAEIILTAAYTNTGCKQSTSYIATIGNGTSPESEVIYTNNRFICLRNDMNSYQWGYDDKITLDSTMLVHENNQDYPDINPDFNNKYYWVITKLNDCMQKSYYNAPAVVQPTNLILPGLTVYPNPVNEILNVRLDNVQSQRVEFRISDIMGRIVLHSIGSNNKTQLDISSLVPGMYTLDCISAEGRIGTAKFIKN